MLKIKEFIYHREDERQFLESRSIYEVIESLFEEIRLQDKIENHKDTGDIFNKKIAFQINKELIPPYQDDNYKVIKENSERITLEQIPIQEIKLNIPKAIINPTYNFKERIKILFKGKV